MKVGLISPQGLLTTDKKLEGIFKETNKMQGLTDSFKGPFNMGLLVIAALIPPDIEVKIIDENYDVIDFDERFDVVGISAVTQQADHAYEIADKFRKAGITVVMGGIHATVMPEEAKTHCDSVFIGEAENTWPVFLNDFRQGKISEFYKGENTINLTESPIPCYDLLQNFNCNIVWVQTSRGCPRDCEFCAASKVYGLQFRHKSVKQIIEEINIIQRLWPSAHINFSDDNLFIDRKYSKILIDHIKELRIRWSALTDISIAKDEVFIDSLKDAGCTSLFIGFESTSEKSLKLINKNSWKLKQLRSYPEAIKRIQARGIGIIGAFVIGLDGDTVETFDELIDFIIDNNIFIPEITIMTPLPGTRLYDRLKKENRLLNKAWKEYTFLEVNFIPKNMTVEDLQKGLYKIYEKVYSQEVRLKTLKYFKNIFRVFSE